MPFKLFFKCLDDIACTIGMILMSIGVFKIYIPAGFIFLGGCFIAVAFIIAKSKNSRLEKK